MRTATDILYAQSNMDSWVSPRMSFSSSMAVSSPLTPSSSSKPMVIPSKGRRENHKPRYNPAVAALLAGTAIPLPPRKSTRRRKVQDSSYYGPATPPTITATFECGIEGEDDGSDDSVNALASPSSSRTALEVLLSPPDEDEDYDSAAMERSGSDGLLSIRSSSTESVPALDTDNESTFSFSSSWSASTPAHRRRRSSIDPRARIVTSPPVECDMNHPLMFSVEDDFPALEPAVELEFHAEDVLKRVTRRLNLVSNLTASLRVLKSAAKSFSSLTASAAALHQPEDYLTRSILSITPQYTDERRPTPSKEVPTPAVRRYLNPWSASYDESPCTGAVQMQTYNVSGGSKTRSKLEDESFVSGAPTVRQREVRENADFLRVIVLEMNMRRGGKLSDSAHGKARYMLPPRQACKARPIGDPARWEARVC